MNRKNGLLLGGALAALTVGNAADASDTVTYSYDALGRLIAVSTSGGPNNGQAVSTGYDPAGNRANYCLATAGTPACPPPGPPPGPPPPPPPPPGNQPPVTAPNTLSLQKCRTATINVVANDSDPEGNVPLVLLSISSSTIGYAALSGTTSVYYESNTQGGTEVLTYTVRDSLGATSTGTLTVTVSGGLINCGA